MKISNKFIYIINSLYFFIAPIKISELYYIKKNKIIIFDFFKILYQYKIGLFLFAAIATRLNIAFVIFCLSRFN